MRQYERSRENLVFDTRPLGEKLASAVASPETALMLMGSLAAGIFFFPHVAEITFLVALGLAWFTRSTQKSVGLVMRMPKTSKEKDPNDIDPATGKPNDAGGIYYMGNCVHTGEEVWLTDTQARTHFLFMGTTGSGKTEYLISTVYNALIHNSGFIYVDGKADSSLYGKLYSMARAFGREDDVLLINFQTGAEDIFGKLPKKVSNTLNMFATGSSGMLIELVKSLKQSSDDDVWTKQADGFVAALIRPLVFLRDKHGLQLDVNVIRKFFELDVIEELAWVYPERYEGLEESGVLDGIRAYLMTKPGYLKAKMHDQSAEVHNQHGYITMQLAQTFGSLADTYGHIMKTPLAEIDFADVFLNRRILVVLLPALENSPAELRNLGRIVVASIKATMAKGLGSAVEGEWAQIIDNKPTNAPSAFPTVLDEWGYYAVEGFSVVPAQARSLGFSAIFAGQDLPAFRKASKEEAASTLGNTNTQLVGKMTCMETFEYFEKVGGKGRYTMLQRYETDRGALGPSNFKADESVGIEQLDRITLESLRGQGSGTWTLLFGNRIVSVKGFYANPKPVKFLRTNHFLRVGRPSVEEVDAYRQSSHIFERALTSEGGLRSYMDVSGSPSDIQDIRDAFAMFAKEPAVKAGGMVLAYCAQREAERAAAYTRLTSANFDLGNVELPAGPDLVPAEQAVDFASALASVADVQSADPLAGNHDSSQPDPFADLMDGFGGGADAGEVTDGAAQAEASQWSSAPSADEADQAAEYDLGTSAVASDPVPASLFGEGLTTTVFGVSETGDEPLTDALDAAADEFGAPEVPISSDWGEPLEFDAPLGDEGLLDRQATVSGVAAIEMATGASREEAQVSAAILAEDLGEVSRYPITPPTAKPDLAKFTGVAKRVTELLGVAADAD